MTEETCGCCGSLIKEGPVFNQRFADYGWCAYDTISEELVHRANQMDTKSIQGRIFCIEESLCFR